MASRTLDVKISASDSASAVFEKVGDSAQSMGKAVEEAAKSSEGMKSFAETIKGLDSEINTVGKAFTGFGAGVTAAVAVGVKQFADLEVAMTNVSTIAGQSDQWIQQMTGSIRNLAVELGTSPTGLAEGLYDIIGSGIEASEAFDVLRTSAIAAKAGMTDTATAASAITAAINAYGKSAKEAGNIADVFFKTVDTGVLTFEELATSLGRTLPLAASLNVSIEELGAAYAQLTLQGISASEAETMIAAVMTAAISPTEELTRAVQEYGYESAEALIQTEGFVGFLRFLEQEAGGSSQRMSELTGNVRATNGALALTRNEMEEYNAALADMNTAAQDGAFTNEVFARQMETLSANLAQARAAWADLSITIGAAVAPAIGAAADIMTTWANLLRAVPEPLQNIASVAISAAGGISLFAGGLLLMVPRIADTVSALSSLNAALLRAGVSLAAIGATVSTAAAVFAALAPPVIAASATMGNFINALRDGHSPSEALTLSFYQLGTAMQQLARGDVVGFFRTLVHGVEEAESSIDKFNETAAKLWHEAARQQALGNTEVAKSLEYMSGATTGVLIEAEKYLQSQEFLNDAKTMAIQMSISEATAQQLLRNEWTLSSKELGVYTEAVDALFAAMLDPSVDGAAVFAQFRELTSDLYARRITLDEYTDGLIALAREYGHLPNDVGAATDSIEEFNATAADGAKALATLFGYEPDTNGPADAIQEIINKNEEAAKSANETAGEITGLIDDLLAMGQEWRQSALEVAGFDNALSQLNMTGLTDDLALFAEEGIRTGQAFDNTFRILVSNVQAIGSSVQQTTDWLSGLFAVNDEGFSQMDTLVWENRISWEQYEQTLAAWNTTAEANYDIQQNLLAVQAMQAPYIAEAVEGTRAWVAELANMDAQTQRTTLAFMDMQTVQQAQEIIALGNSEAFLAMGESGRTAFEAVIQGALQTNPLLFDVLETMGIINGTPVDFDINWDALAEGGSAMQQLTQSVDDLVSTLREIYGLPPLDLEVNTGSVEAAAEVVDFLYERVTNADGTEAYLIVRVDEAGKETIDEIVSSVDNLDGTYTVQVEAETGETYEAILSYDGEVLSTTYIDVQTRINGGVGAGALAAGGLGDLRSQLNLPEEIVTTITTIVEGQEQVTTVSTAIENIPDSKDATVGITVTGLEDLESAKTAIDELDDKTVTVSITGDAGGADGALTVLDNLKSGGKEGHQVTVKLVADDSDVTSTIASLSGAPGGGSLPGEPGGPTITVHLKPDTSALSLESLNLGSLYPDGLEISVSVTTTGHDTAVTNLNNVQSAAEAVPETADVTTTVYAWAAAVNNLNAVQSAAESIPTSVTTGVNVSGWVSAVAALNSVANAARSIPASVSTTVTTNVVTNRITRYSTQGFPTAALGGLIGVPSFAGGGTVPVWAGENGPEIARFANGGAAILPYEGMYAVPPMTYISPSHANPQAAGGVTIQIGPIYGSNREEIYDVFDREIVPEMLRALREQDRSMGVA